MTEPKPKPKRRRKATPTGEQFAEMFAQHLKPEAVVHEPAPEPKVRLSVTLPASVVRKVKIQAIERGLSVGDVIRQAIEDTEWLMDDT